MDVDIHVFRKDGKPIRTYYSKPYKETHDYDRQRTSLLAKMIVEVAGRGAMDKSYFNDPEVQKLAPGLITYWRNHDRHVKLRLAEDVGDRGILRVLAEEFEKLSSKGTKTPFASLAEYPLAQSSRGLRRGRESSSGSKTVHCVP